VSLPVDTLLAGRYRLGGPLGSGGMAEVHEAVDERLRRPVAVKVLRPALAAEPGMRKRFEAEARSAARLSHHAVVAVYDSGEDAGRPYLVMERLPGASLADRMAAGPVDVSWIGAMAGDVLGALDAAHRAGIVHRDVKPANILITEDGRAKLSDFGIAKAVQEAPVDLTGADHLVGTPAYLAPERIDGLAASPGADLYALGVVLYEALGGVRAFPGTTPISVAYAVRHADLAPLGSLRPGLDPALVSVVERAMARDPRERFASAAEMAAALAGPASWAASDPDATMIDPTEVAAVSRRDRDPTLPGGRPALPVGRRLVGRRALAAALGAGIVVAGILASVVAGDGAPPASAGETPTTPAPAPSTTTALVEATTVAPAPAPHDGKRHGPGKGKGGKSRGRR